MNPLEELFLTKDDQYITSLYRKYKRQENYISASRLRTAYIQHFLFKNEFKLTTALMFFIQEESYIIGIHAERWRDREFNEFNQREFTELPEYTRINPFLYQKLLKENWLNPNHRWNFNNILATEGNFLTFSLYEKVFNETMFRLYSTDDLEEKENAIRTLLSFNDSFTSNILRDFRAAVVEGRAIYPIEEEVNNRFIEFEDNPVVKTVELQWLTEMLLSLFAYYYYDNDLQAMQLTYLRLMKILPTSHPVYWTVKFFEKELKLTEIE